MNTQRVTAKYYGYRYVKGPLKGCLHPSKSHLISEGVIKIPTSSKMPFDSVVLHIEEEVGYFVVDHKEISKKEFNKWK